MTVIDPGPVPAAAIPAPAPAAVPAAPWAADAVAYFGDDAAAAGNFDRYMRERQQPYITQLEEGSADARELWTDLNNDPAQALKDLVSSVYREDPEFVAAYEALFTPAEPVVEPPPAAAVPDEIPEWAKPLVETHQAKVDREATEAAAAEYAAAKTELQGKHADLTDADLALIDPFVYGAGGDMEAAYVGYNAWRVQAGLAPAAAPAVPAPTPPPVLGVGVAATPPIATQYTSYGQLGAALKDYSARQAVSATPPPVVG